MGDLEALDDKTREEIASSISKIAEQADRLTAKRMIAFDEEAKAYASRKARENDPIWRLFHKLAGLG